MCPVSCGTCTEMCLDKQNDCPLWAADGQCGTNAGFMLRACPHSCGVCDEQSHASSTHPVLFGQKSDDGRKLSERVACADTDRTQCLIWGEQECDANPSAVMKACPATCGVCTLAVRSLRSSPVAQQHVHNKHPSTLPAPPPCYPMHANALDHRQCEDKYADCPQWTQGKKSVFGTQSGQGCTENSAFMLPNWFESRLSNSAQLAPPSDAQRLVVATAPTAHILAASARCCTYSPRPRTRSSGHGVHRHLQPICVVSRAHMLGDAATTLPVRGAWQG